MKYNNIVKGIFVDRPNRFIAHVMVDGNVETVHVKNTGRCKELLLPNCVVYLEKSNNPNRKTLYDLIGVEKAREGKEKLIINMDSQAPNQAAETWLKKGTLFSKNAIIRREVTFGKSRFDFYIEDGDKKVFLEVKGVTLEKDGIAAFPDAPTERGVKHILELTECLKEGYEAYILFVVQMKEMKKLIPNDATHKAFGDALRFAKSMGVNVIAMDCIVTPATMTIDSPIEVDLD